MHDKTPLHAVCKIRSLYGAKANCVSLCSIFSLRSGSIFFISYG